MTTLSVHHDQIMKFKVKKKKKGFCCSFGCMFLVLALEVDDMAEIGVRERRTPILFLQKNRRCKLTLH